VCHGGCRLQDIDFFRRRHAHRPQISDATVARCRPLATDRPGPSERAIPPTPAPPWTRQATRESSTCPPAGAICIGADRLPTCRQHDVGARVVQSQGGPGPGPCLLGQCTPAAAAAAASTLL